MRAAEELTMLDTCVATHYTETTVNGQTGRVASVVYSGKCAIKPFQAMPALRAVGERPTTYTDFELKYPWNAARLVEGDDVAVTNHLDNVVTTYRVLGPLDKSEHIRRRVRCTRIT